MGWRFRKSIKILPGVRLNIGKRGVTSASVGPKGFTSNISDKGVRNTVGVPGTGLSYTSSPAPGSGAAARTGAIAGGVIAIIVLLFSIAMCATCATISRNSRPVSNAQTPRPLYSVPTATPSIRDLPSPSPTITPKGKRPSPTPTASPVRADVYTPPPPVTSRGPNGPRQSGLIRGPRGGCYYWNSRGNKTYVDRSLCN